MKNSLKTILILSFSVILIYSFFVPKTTSQEWTYDGVDTERIPGFSVYPSEWYIANTTAIMAPHVFPPENYTIMEVIKGNSTDIMLGTNYGDNGTCIWVNLWSVNSTSGEKFLALGSRNVQLAWWNPTVNYSATFLGIIPVESDGKVSAEILNNVTLVWENIYFPQFGVTFQHKQIYPNIYSYKYWNNTGAYFYQNFTADGINTKTQHNSPLIFYPNITLVSQPAQLPPEFSFTTEHDILTVNSTEFKLKITITDADNNNDGETDTDYLYRIQNGTEWSDWATIPDLLDWDLGDVEEGDYDITVEVKNMYGVTQEEITIEFTLPEVGDGNGEEIIPGYPLFLVLTLFTIITSVLIRKHRKK